MDRFIRTVLLFAAGAAVLVVTVAMVAIVVTAAPAAVRSSGTAGERDFRGARDLSSAPTAEYIAPESRFGGP